MAYGRTLTRQLTVEARQHDLLGLDLGEGPKRSTIGLGLIAFLAWFPVCWLLVGPPNANSLTLFLLPPGILLGVGLQDDEANPRRAQLTRWALRIRYVLRGHAPVLHLGAGTARHSERIPLLFRLLSPTAAARVPLPTHWFVPDSTARIGIPRRGRPMRLHQTARLYGTDYLARMIEQKATRR